jgi:hypothetical protein
MASVIEEQLRKALAEAQAKLDRVTKAAKKAKREWKPDYPVQHRGY